MLSKRIKKAGAATIGALTLTATVFTSTASADVADDVQIMIENAPAAVDAVGVALQMAADNFEAGGYGYPITQLSFDLAYVPQAAADALTAGTEQFGSLGLGIGIIAGSPLGILLPQLMALDEDPASVVDTIDPNDVPLLVANLPAAMDAANPFVMEAVTSLLEGNLVEGEGSFPGVDTPAVIGSSISAVTVGFRALIQGTTHEANGTDYTVGGTLLVPAVAVAGYAQQAEDALAPVFEALTPATAPIVAALGG